MELTVTFGGPMLPPLSLLSKVERLANQLSARVHRSVTLACVQRDPAQRSVVEVVVRLPSRRLVARVKRGPLPAAINAAFSILQHKIAGADAREGRLAAKAVATRKRWAHALERLYRASATPVPTPAASADALFRSQEWVAVQFYGT